MTLEEASLAKFDRICDKLELGPDDHVLEIGTGWGGFAVHAAATRGCRVTTTTISREQHDHAVRARARARAWRIASPSCWRTTATSHGRYDKLVSIEMIEAVGWKDFDTFFRVCSDRLAPDGAMLLQAIVDGRPRLRGRAREQVLHPHADLPQRVPAVARGDRPLRRARHRPARRPPGGPDPALRRDAASAGARTSTAAEGELEALGYDERFRRLWRLYLAYCEAGFAERRIGLVQTVLAKPHWRPPVMRRGRGAPGAGRGGGMTRGTRGWRSASWASASPTASRWWPRPSGWPAAGWARRPRSRRRRSRCARSASARR